MLPTQRLVPSVLASLLSAALFLVPLSQVVAAQSYIVTDLGVLPGGIYSNGFDVNNRGQATGHSDLAGGGDNAFLWDGAMHDLGTQGYEFSMGFGINDSGVVAGMVYGNDGARAFTYDGTMHLLGTLGGTWSSSAASVNNSGVVVGSASITGQLTQHAFKYDGTMHDLGTFGTSGGEESYATDINEAGQITGSADGPSGRHAFLYDGTMHDLGTLGSDGTYSQGMSINNLGQITGWSENDDPWPMNKHAFFYDGTMHDLGVLPDPWNLYSEGHGINDLGQIVGISYRNGGWGHAFLHTTATGMTDLNTLIDPNSGWELLEADGINNLGQIVGYGWINGDTHGFLLTPVPEPRSWLLAVLGGLVCVLGRWRSWPLV